MPREEKEWDFNKNPIVKICAPGIICVSDSESDYCVFLNNVSEIRYHKEPYVQVVTQNIEFYFLFDESVERSKWFFNELKAKIFESFATESSAKRARIE